VLRLVSLNQFCFGKEFVIDMFGYIFKNDDLPFSSKIKVFFTCALANQWHTKKRY
jgi:hypothetical protein